MTSRASSWLIGFALGGSAAFAWRLAALVWGWPWGWEVGLSVWLSVWLSVPSLEWLGQFMVDTRAEWLHPERVLSGPAAPPALVGSQPLPDPAPLAPLNSNPLDEWEAHHVEGMELTLQHAAAAGSFTSTALVGAAFRDNEHWGYWMGCLSDSRIVSKINGLPTILRDGLTFTAARRQLRRGEFEIPAQYLGSPYPPLPAPFQPNLPYKVKLEKPIKAAEKV